MTKTANKIDAIDLNDFLDPFHVLNLIGYEKSAPHKSNGEIRDYCPIHEGKNPTSLSINPQKKCFQCFSCGAKGDLITLYGLAKGYEMPQDLPKALEELAAATNYQRYERSFNSQITQVTQKKLSTSERRCCINRILPSFL